MQLTGHEQALLAGSHGEAAATAMRILIRLGTIRQAPQMIEISQVHIDACTYQGEVSLDFPELLARQGARLTVPTTLNVGIVDLLHPTLYRGDEAMGRAGRRLMEVYREMGARPTFTCAPYQLRTLRPCVGEQVAWAESNAIAFCNSVLGARTDRYGDFIDVCAAIAGRVPYAGLHVTENRRATLVLALDPLPAALVADNAFAPVLGHLLGSIASNEIAAITGIETISEDGLKALGAAGASSGAVALFHVVGVTPEAPTLDAALQGQPPQRTVRVTAAMLRQARDELSTSAGETLAGASIGTPHLSPEEFAELDVILADDERPFALPFYVNCGREQLELARGAGHVERFERLGGTVVTDTCTYITPIMEPRPGAWLTNSGKWAYYAPGNLGLDVVFGSVRECVRSVQDGSLWRDREVWGDR